MSKVENLTSREVPKLQKPEMSELGGSLFSPSVFRSSSHLLNFSSFIVSLSRIVPRPSSLVPRSFPGTQRGFTLIELLVAISIALIVVIAAYTTLFTIQKGTAQVYEKMRDNEKIYNFLSMIRKEVEGIYFSRDQAYTGLKIEEYDFYGNPASKLSYTSYFKDGLKIISYKVEEDGSRRLNLIKTIMDGVKNERPLKITVLKDIKGFKAQVLDEGYDKVYDSEKLKKLPKCMKVTILLKAGGATQEFSQICSLMVTE